MQKELSTKFKNHKNPEIVAIANNLGDGFANDIRRQLARPKIAGVDDKFNITVNNTNNEPLALEVTKIDGHLFVTFDGVDDKGNPKKIALPSLSGQGGMFNGPAELIQSMKIVNQLQGADAARALKTGSLIK